SDLMAANVAVAKPPQILAGMVSKMARKITRSR
ncbi:MAG: hypothetical protein ACI9K9_002449, partial [Neolewinella sp.]